MKYQNEFEVLIKDDGYTVDEVEKAVERMYKRWTSEQGERHHAR